MKATELQAFLESKFRKAIDDSNFYEDDEWVNCSGSAVVGNETIPQAARAAAAVIVGIAEAQEYAIESVHLKDA